MSLRIHHRERSRGRLLESMACVKARRGRLAFYVRQTAPNRLWRAVDSWSKPISKGSAGAVGVTAQPRG